MSIVIIISTSIRPTHAATVMQMPITRQLGLPLRDGPLCGRFRPQGLVRRSRASALDRSILGAHEQESEQNVSDVHMPGF